jgi:periplasmic protein TonB
MASKGKFNLFVIIFICLQLLVFKCATAQSQKSACSGLQDTLLHKVVYKFVDEMPEPVGGLASFYKYLSKQIKYPSSSQEIGGRIIVAFVIEKNGTIDGERIVKDFASGNHDLGKQVLDAIKHYQWKPGSCNGKPVPVLYFIPLTIDTSQE